LADRFGTNSNVGSQVLMKTKSNILYGIGATFIFGDNVKETNMLDGLKTSQGQIINSRGQDAEVYYYERGFHLAGYLGAILPIGNLNKNSGFFILGGVGLLQHKIRIHDKNEDIPGLYDDYKKGYDRLTNGLATSEMIGYQYLSSRRMINFYVGVEFLQGFTQNRRSYNYDLMEKDETKRLDLLTSIRFGWIIPAYKKTPKDFYFN
jgi:hypothetical protein